MSVEGSSCVYLARLLASPYWTSLPLDDHIQRDPRTFGTVVGGKPLTWLDTMFTKDFAIRLSIPGIERFVAEGKRTIAPGFQRIPEPRSGIHSTLGGWVLDRLLERAGLQPIPRHRLRPEPDAFRHRGATTHVHPQ
ncbi:hypothetical protein GCM10009838_68380 [Catenulispora subtropica]|uniref:Uncharacterized protein n=1 Tax=Catenulispora subtropica TaxID=450798 RepID=A0ABN2SZM2_9ACTN